jgi:hypothetical protein
MDMKDTPICTEWMLNEQIAKEVREIQPENGPVVVIIDRDGTCWPSDAERFAKLNLDEALLKELCTKVDDGVEPVIAQINDCSVVAGQLSTERTNCGFALIALPHYGPESTLANIDLVEMLLGQIGLIGKLIEKHNQARELHMKQFSRYGLGEALLS